MPLGRDPCKMTAETPEFMIEETGSDYARQNTRAGWKEVLCHKEN